MLARVRSLLPLAAICLFAGCQSPVAPEPAAGSALETHYSPVENLEHYDLALLNSARRSIDLCGFSFTDAAVGDALVRAAGRGVRVRVYLDRGESDAELHRTTERKSRSKRGFDGGEGFPAEDFSGAEDAGNAGNAAVIATLATTQNVQVRLKHSRVLMHLKSYAVDEAILRTGSANFSPSALKRQDNDLLLTRDSAAVRRFELNFAQLWSRTDNEPLQP